MAKKTSAKTPALTAKTADPHLLYQYSVQEPEADVEFLHRVFKKTFGRRAKTLREDFCGTSRLACEWVKGHDDCEAFGVDNDPKPLEWAREHNLTDIPEERQGAVHLEEGDVREAREPKVDVQVAFNFSYCCFFERSDLLDYFRAARDSIAEEGLLVLDIHGGPEAMDECREKKTVHGPGIKGVKYVWNQGDFDPINHRIDCWIGFEFKDGTKIKKAFTYSWRLWTLPELRDALLECGFSAVDVYWEGEDKKTGEGTGIYRKAKKGTNDPSWIAYVVATR